MEGALSDPDLPCGGCTEGAVHRMPARPLTKWVYMMFGRGAVLDGIAGMAYATLQSFL